MATRWGVAGEITQHMMRAAERRLGIDDPVLTEQGAQEGTECFLILEGFERTGERELTHLKSSLQSGDELTAEDATQYADGQEEGIAGMDPAGVIWRETSSWDQTMDMRMSQQILAPGMQDGEESDLRSQVLGIGGNLQKGLRTGAEQEVINDLLVLQRQMGELVRQGKDNVDIGDRQEFVLAGSDPLIASSALALGAVPIPATIEGDGAIAAARTVVAMATECRGTATCDSAEHFAVGPVNPPTVVLDEAIALRTNDIGHLEERPGHFFRSLRGRWTSSRLETSRASRGLGTARRCLGER
jgi:hypothetical protein